jgi:glycosyltransferase involved in cell wall biosynthesis
MKLSGVVTCFNSAETLARCLQSLQFCDEIIVLDSGSSDASVAIAKAHSAVVHVQAFAGFAKQKSAVIALAQFPWVVLLDADEWLAEGAEVLIRAAILQTDMAGFRLPRRERIFWRYAHPSTRNNDFLRLFLRDQAQMSGHAVHESPQVHGKTAKLPALIWHNGERSIALKADKLNQYSSLALADWKHQKRPGFLRLTLYPLWYFFRAYVLKRQFLNGWAGYINSVELAHYAFLKYAKRLEALQAPIRDPEPVSKAKKPSKENPP